MTLKCSIRIDHDRLNQAYSYEGYWDLIRNLMAQGKTTGNNSSQDYLYYTQLNIQRMERQDAKDLINPELKAQLATYERPLNWIVLVEWWCGDVAQNLPTIYQMTKHSSTIELYLLLRDENLDIMDQFLTDGSRSIPMLICHDPISNWIIGQWGPRPAPAQALLREFKANPNGRSKEDFQKELHLWYARDCNQTLQREFAELLQQWARV